MLRSIGAIFAAAAVASGVVLSVIGGNDIQVAVGIGVWIDRTLALVVPLVVLLLATRTAPRTPLRTASLVTGGACSSPSPAVWRR